MDSDTDFRAGCRSGQARRKRSFRVYRPGKTGKKESEAEGARYEVFHRKIFGQNGEANDTS